MDHDKNVLALNQIKSLVADFGFEVTISIVGSNGGDLWCIGVDGQMMCHAKFNSAVKAAGDYARGRQQ